jgi:hypothetical protein
VNPNEDCQQDPKQYQVLPLEEGQAQAVNLSAQKRPFIVDTVKMQVPENYHEQYLKVLLRNCEAISQDKFDLGRTGTLVHEIALKSQEPINHQRLCSTEIRLECRCLQKYFLI